jgi:hypothetical protein
MKLYDEVRLGLVLILGTVGCRSTPPEYAPEEVVCIWQGFLDQNAFDSARLYSTAATVRYIDLLDELTTSEGAAVMSVTLLRELRCTVTGNTARCFFVIKDEIGRDVPDTLELRLVKGRWLVDWKASVSQGYMDSLLEGTPSGRPFGDSIDPELE